MNKLNKMLAVLGALLMLTVTSANSVEFKAGISANGMGAYANVEEKLKDSSRISNEEAVLAAAFASGFLEVGSEDLMGLSFGVSYAPEVAELNKETRVIQPSGTGDSGTQIIDGKIVDLVSVYLSLPEADKRFFDAFTKAKGEERERILEMVPEDQVELYKNMWSRMDRGEDIGLYSGTKSKVDQQYMQRKYQELDAYFADKPMPGADWIGWHKDVDINDIKVKYVSNLGGEIHDYDMWNSQVRRVSRKPYLEDSDLFMYEDPSAPTRNMYTNMGFQLMNKGLFNSSYNIYENSRAEILYNDKRESEINMLMMQALEG